MIPIRIRANHLARDDSYRGTTLTLPADKTALLDALDMARVPYGSGEYSLSGNQYTPDFLKTVMESSMPSLSEMNRLAERLESLSDESVSKMEGIPFDFQ